MSDQHEARDRREQFAMVGRRAFSYWAKGRPTKLTPSCFIVYTALVFRASQHDRRCFPSLQTIADDTGVSRDTVSVAIRKLEAAGLISVEQRYNSRGQTSSIYTILEVPDAEKSGGPVGNPDSPVSENPTHPHRKTRHELEPGEPDPGEPERPSDGCAGNPSSPGNPGPDHQATLPADPPAREINHNPHGRSDGEVYALVDAYLKAKGIKPHDVQGKDRKQAFTRLRDLPAWAGPAEVAACVGYVLTDSWWREAGRLNINNFAGQLLDWDAIGRPDAKAPNEAHGGKRGRGRVGGYSAEELMAMAMQGMTEEGR